MDGTSGAGLGWCFPARFNACLKEGEGQQPAPFSNLIRTSGLEEKGEAPLREWESKEGR